MSLRPTPAQERWLKLAGDLGASPRAAAFLEHTGGWRTAGLLSRCAFFALGLIAAYALAALLELLRVRGSFLIAGALAIAGGEWLIRARRNFFGGLEEAFCSAGALMVAYELGRLVQPAPRWEPWILGAALALAGLRLLNPLLTTLAVLAFAYALDASRQATGLLCFGTALAALAAGALWLRRPAYDRMLDWLVITLPFAGYLWLAAGPYGAAAHDYRHAPLGAWLVPLAPLAFALMASATGILRRTHAPLWAAMLCVACTAYELRALSGLTLQMRLLLWGAVLLGASAALERYLRTPRAGITSRTAQAAAGLSDLLSVVASAGLTPHAAPAAADRPLGAGGQFGGGGASGEF